jgi:hypothetical protein
MMNGQFDGVRNNLKTSVEGPNPEMNQPVVKSDPFQDKGPDDPDYINDPRLEVAHGAVAVMNVTPVDDIPLPAGVDPDPRIEIAHAASGLMDEETVHEAPEMRG